MSTATNANESYCTFTLASDTTAGGLPSQEEIAKQLESSDPKVSYFFIEDIVHMIFNPFGEEDFGAGSSGAKYFISTDTVDSRHP